MKPVALAAAAIAVLLAGFLTAPADAATSWTAKIGSAYGSATVAQGTSTRLSVAAKNFRARTTYTVTLRRGTCASVGTLILSRRMAASSLGKITQTLTLTASQARIVKLPMAIRVGTRCGAFKAAAAPLPMPALGVPAVAVGWEHSCALLPDGTVKCWGRNDAGQLGDGTLVDRTGPAPVVGLSGVTTISASWRHTCAIVASGAVRCWGKNTLGELGDGTTTNRVAPVAVQGLPKAAVALSGGGAGHCALLIDGTVWCWGWNAGGELGDGTTVQRLRPVAVTGLSGVTAIAGGDADTCALLRTGTVKCWGLNASGEVGDGTRTQRLHPVDVVGLSGVTAITGGSSHACALLADETVRCWGNGEEGRLGTGVAGDSLLPVAVANLSGVAAISAGASFHTCAVLRDSTVRCWGSNSYGELGDGTTTGRSTPVPVVGLTGASAVSAGPSHTCAQLASGQVSCWGKNGRGALGDGTTVDRTTPVTVVGL